MGVRAFGQVPDVQVSAAVSYMKKLLGWADPV